MFLEKSNTALLAEFNARVYGHLTAKKALITLVNRSKMRHFQKYELGETNLLEPCKLLLLGSSGTGKTMLVEQLQQMFDFPLLRLDATQLSPGSGKDVLTQDAVKKLCVSTVKEWMEHRRATGYTVSLEGACDQLVIFIDEMDKLATSFESSGNWNKHIQNSFLTMFDNHDDGAGVSFIFSGAFSDMKETKKNHIGFNKAVDNVKPILDDAIIKHGLIPELVGRLTAIVELDTFTADDYKHILNNILLPQKKHHLTFFKEAQFDITDGQIETLTRQALTSGQGIRYLKRQLDALALDVEFNYELGAKS